MINNDLKNKTQKQLYGKVLRPFICDFLSLLLTVITFIIMRFMWIGGVFSPRFYCKFIVNRIIHDSCNDIFQPFFFTADIVI